MIALETLTGNDDCLAVEEIFNGEGPEAAVHAASADVTPLTLPLSLTMQFLLIPQYK